jgi:hypothetical protein
VHGFPGAALDLVASILDRRVPSGSVFPSRTEPVLARLDQDAELAVCVGARALTTVMA